MRIVRQGKRAFLGQLVPGADPIDLDSKRKGIRCYKMGRGLITMLFSKGEWVRTDGTGIDGHCHVINKKSAKKWLDRHGGELGADLWQSVEDTYESVLPQVRNTPDAFLDQRRHQKLHKFRLSDHDAEDRRLQVSKERMPLTAPSLTVPDDLEFYPDTFLQLGKHYLGSFDNWETVYLPRLETWARTATADETHGPLLSCYLAAIIQCLAEDHIGNDMKESVLLNIVAEASCTPGMIVRAQKEYARLHIEGPMTCILREIEDLKSDVLNSLFQKGVSGDQSVHFVAGSTVHFGHRLGLDVEAAKRDPYHGLGPFNYKLRYWDRKSIFKKFHRRFEAEALITRIVDTINANKDSSGRILGLAEYNELVKKLLLDRYRDFQVKDEKTLLNGILGTESKEILGDSMLRKQVTSKQGAIDIEKLRDFALSEFISKRFFELDEDELICGIKPLAIELILIEMGVVKRRNWLYGFWKRHIS